MNDSSTLDRLLDPNIRHRRPAADSNTPRPTVLPDFTAGLTAEVARDSDGPHEGVSDDNVPNDEIPDNDYTAFAHGRISRHPQMMLAFHKASGEIEAFPYSLLTRLHTDDPSTNITLHFGSTVVTIHGQNLTRLFTHLCHHRAATITQSDRTAAFSNENDCVVTEIRVISPRQTTPQSAAGKHHLQSRSPN